jgi:hypothetical protein
VGYADKDSFKQMNNTGFDNDMENQVNITVITKLPNSEQSYKGKVKTHKYINRQNQSTTGKL